jgi:hypothetical protein
MTKSTNTEFPKTIKQGGKTYKLSSVHRLKRIANLKATKLHHDMYSSTRIMTIGKRHGVYYAK